MGVNRHALVNILILLKIYFFLLANVVIFAILSQEFTKRRTSRGKRWSLGDQ